MQYPAELIDEGMLDNMSAAACDSFSIKRKTTTPPFFRLPFDGELAVSETTLPFLPLGV